MQAACAITLTDDGNIFVSGGIDINNGNNLDVELCKITQDGELLWQRFYGGEENDYAWTMLPTQDAGFIMGGRSKENDTIKIAVLKVNCMGLLTEPAAAFAAYQTGDSPLEMAFQN